MRNEDCGGLSSAAPPLWSFCMFCWPENWDEIVEKEQYMALSLAFGCVLPSIARRKDLPPSSPDDGRGHMRRSKIMELAYVLYSQGGRGELDEEIE